MDKPKIPQYIRDIVAMHEFRYTLPDSYKPYFDWYIQETWKFPEFLGESCKHPRKEYRMGL